MNQAKNYTKTHEWVQFGDNGTAKIGLTDFAQKELGDLVFINLCEEGDTVEVGKPFADVESVKAVSDVFSPLSATVIKINEDLLTEPELINASAETTWLIEVENVTAQAEFFTLEEYIALNETSH